MESNPFINLINLSISFIPNNNDTDILNDSFQSQEIPSNPTNNEYLNNLNIITIDEITQDNECCICLEQFKKGDKIIKLPCPNKSHYFHAHETDQCKGIMPWLKNNNTCPICRYELPKETNNDTVQGQNNDTIPDNDETTLDNDTSLDNDNHEIYSSNTLNNLNRHIYDIINNYITEQDNHDLDVAITRSIYDT